MIKLESVHIEETRGIRSLGIEFGKKNFAISGPNGSGKSGVIDAIEFGLTGEIKRLAGSGTKGLSVAEHGPHVDKVKFSDASFVELKLFLPKLGKSATIRRWIKSTKKPVITPDEPDVRETIEAVAAHPEITLSRRDIIRFILVEPSKRSQEIQALLKLDELGDTRAALYTAQNKLQRAYSQAQGNSRDARAALIRHLQIDQPTAELVLAAVTERRKILGIDEITTLTAGTQLDAGLEAGQPASRFNKASTLRDIGALSEFAGTVGDLGATDVNDPGRHKEARRRSGAVRDGAAKSVDRERS